MKTSTLQALRARLSNQITYLEKDIRDEKFYINLHKSQGRHKDYYEYRYKRIAIFRRELENLVKIQREIKAELKENVELLREFLDYE